MTLLADYQSIPSVQQIVILEQAAAACTVWTRGEAEWLLSAVDGVQSELDLTSLQLRLSLAEAYDGLNLAPGAQA